MGADADRARALHTESKRLEQFLLTLKPEAWRQPSRCPGWQVADVVAHLIEDEYAERLARGLRGDLTPAGFVPDATLQGEALQAQIIQHPIALQQRLGDDLLSAFGAENDRVDRLLASLAPPAWETPATIRGGLGPCARSSISACSNSPCTDGIFAPFSTRRRSFLTRACRACCACCRASCGEPFARTPVARAPCGIAGA